MVRLSGIEPPLSAPEADALSTELQAYACVAVLIIAYKPAIINYSYFCYNGLTDIV